VLVFSGAMTTAFVFTNIQKLIAQIQPLQADLGKYSSMLIFYNYSQPLRFGKVQYIIQQYKSATQLKLNYYSQARPIIKIQKKTKIDSAY